MQYMAIIYGHFEPLCHVIRGRQKYNYFGDIISGVVTCISELYLLYITMYTTTVK